MADLQLANATLSISKTGTGTQVFNGASTYDGGTIVSGGTLVAGNGTALGAGDVSITGDGSLSLDESATIELTLGGNFQMDDGMLLIDLVDASTFDSFSGTGSFTITGGELSLSLDPGFADYGSTFQLFSGFSGNTVSNLAITGYDTGTYTAQLDDTGILSFTAIPEPTVGSLLAIGAVLLGVRQRRFQRNE